MEKKKCSELNNMELKEYSISIENEFEAKKAKLQELCEELADLEDVYNEIQNEMKIRRTIY